jgi:small redox-active disulfide protein 2
MNCKTLERRTQEAVQHLGIDATIQKVQSFPEIAAYGIMKTPGLVIDEKVVSAGTVPTVEKIEELLQAYQSV